jgi:tRNA-splicing ligase RtcB
MNDRLRLTIPIEKIDPGAVRQINAALELPFLKALAVMPDVHQGYDLPIGGVALLDDHIWPGAVGYDIGCGMCHINTGKTVGELPDIRDVFERIVKMIPVGSAGRQQPAKKFSKFPNGSGYAVVEDAICHKAAIQLGTLGGGNHFIEIGVNKNGIIGITIHSGSRRPGWLIGDFYMKLTGGPVGLDSDAAKAYIADMNWALQFALDNRSVMMSRCLQALGLSNELMNSMVNENHNHAVITPQGVLHRKGATPADNGQIGIIPANMRDGVWITRGLGNTEFLSSASHGAGRVMSRNKARKSLDCEEFASQMNGIISPSLEKLIDEAPDAYKDINNVIAAQDGIVVDVIDHFRPLAVVKG